VKWVGLLSVLAAIFPLAWWIRRASHASPKLWFLVGLLPFVTVPLHLFMAAISWLDWDGFVHGIEFSVLDGLAISLWLSVPRGTHQLPFKGPMAFYFLAVLVPALTARSPIAALFYPWQLMRMFVIYAAVTRGVSSDPRVAPAVLKGMATGLLLEAGITVWQRFGLGLLQPAGTFDAQNLLGLISHLIAFPFFALFLRGKVGMFPGAVVLVAAIVEVLTTSRATIALAGLGFAAVFLLSAVRRCTTRKMLIFAVGVAMTGVITPMVFSSLEQRALVNNVTESDTERDSFIRAAEMMLSDHPLGVGPNHFNVIANIDGYYQRADVQPNSRASIVHNVYWLVACETGWVGLIAFLLLLLRPVQVAFFCGWRNREDIRGDLMIGFGVALLIVCIHSYFEWIFLIHEAQWMFTIEIALVAGLAQRLGYWPTRATVRLVRPYLSGTPGLAPRARPRWQ
jgi:hypothetical protein